MKKASQSDYKSVCSPLAERLTELMKVNDKKQADIAELLEVTRQSVSQYCGGVSLPPVDKLVMLADYFDVSTDYLLGRTDVKTTDTTVKEICAYTGLCEEAIKVLKYFENDVEFIDTLNFIISQEDCSDGNEQGALLSRIIEFINIELPQGSVYEIYEGIITPRKDRKKHDFTQRPIRPFTIRLVAMQLMLAEIEKELRSSKDKYNAKRGVTDVKYTRETK